MSEMIKITVNLKENVKEMRNIKMSRLNFVTVFVRRHLLSI